MKRMTAFFGFGGKDESRCRVTITDKFGGRGHDFQVIDKEANANGGMLVIATSIPDEREWIQCACNLRCLSPADYLLLT